MIARNMLDWLLGLINQFAEFGGWLTTPLDHIGLSPLALFGISGLTAVIGWSIVRLVVGG